MEKLLARRKELLPSGVRSPKARPPASVISLPKARITPYALQNNSVSSTSTGGATGNTPLEVLAGLVGPVARDADAKAVFRGPGYVLEITDVTIPKVPGDNC